MNSNYDSFGIYLKSIGACNPLSAEEEKALFSELKEAKAKNNQEKALEIRNKILFSNLKLVIDIVKDKICSTYLLDLIQECSLLLIDCIDRYQPKFQQKFSTYAYLCLHCKLINLESRLSGVIRVPAQTVREKMRMKAIKSDVEFTECREVDVEYLSEITGLSKERVSRLLTALPRIISTDAPSGDHDDESLTIGDSLADTSSIPPDEMTHLSQLRNAINTLLEAFPERDVEIFEYVHGLNGKPVSSYSSLQKRYKITRSRIEQINKKMLRKLRHPAKLKILKEFRNDPEID